MNGEENARDPYVGLNRHISQRAQELIRAPYCIGTVLSLKPVKIRADGLDLDADDLRVPEAMLPRFLGEEPESGRGIRTMLPRKEFPCLCAMGGGVVVREKEFVYGETVLRAGDEVLLLRADDGQTYYVIERMVQLGTAAADR